MCPRRTIRFIGLSSTSGNRNKTKHLPYGEGTLRAEPLAEALARFARPATVVSESPDEASSQAIRAVLEASSAGRHHSVAGDEFGRALEEDGGELALHPGDRR